jgi:uncharacterized protein YdiU (UPF0061 family)
LYGKRRGALVALDPKTGEVLAFVSKPTFDPNLFVDGIDSENWAALNESIDKPLLNRALRGTYPPGSTYKPFMALAALETYKTLYPALADQAFAAKLGLPQMQTDDHTLVEHLLQVLAAEKTDFTIFWRRLSHAVATANLANSAQAFAPVRDMFMDAAPWDAWLPSYLQRLNGMDLQKTGIAMLTTNPKFVLRNHLGEQVIQQAKIGDYSGIDQLLQVLSSPFDEHPAFEHFAAFPPDWASSISISCSS